jgi:hypothetical protein
MSADTLQSLVLHQCGPTPPPLPACIATRSKKLGRLGPQIPHTPPHTHTHTHTHTQVGRWRVRACSVLTLWPRAELASETQRIHAAHIFCPGTSKPNKKEVRLWVCHLLLCLSTLHSTATCSAGHPNRAVTKPCDSAGLSILPVTCPSCLVLEKWQKIPAF